MVEPPPPLPDPTRDVLVTTVSLPLSRSWIRGDRGNSSWFLDSILWSIGEYFVFLGSYFLHLMTQQQCGGGGTYFLEMETLDDMTTTMRRRSYHLVSPPPPLPDPTRDVLVTTVSLPLSRSWIRGDRGNSSLVPLILFSGLLDNTLSFFGEIFLHLMTQQH